uniref:MTA7p n=1 Tax=Tetrahymena thermophila TaxID=5911 RepID=M1KK84_TETTH|nr:MTA7p [Tetrahymena thermophila]
MKFYLLTFLVKCFIAFQIQFTIQAKNNLCYHLIFYQSLKQILVSRAFSYFDFNYFNIDRGIIFQFYTLDLIYIQITTNDFASLNNSTLNNYFSSKMMILSQPSFSIKQNQTCFLPLAQNTYNRVVGLDIYDRNNNLLYNLQVKNKVLIKLTTQKLVYNQDNSMFLSLTFNVFEQFRIIDPNLQEYFQIQISPQNKSQTYPQYQFRLLADNQEISSYQTVQGYSYFAKQYNQSSFPTQFTNLEIIFSDYSFQTVYLQLALGAAQTSMTIYNQYYSVQQLQIANFNALIKPAPQTNFLGNEIDVQLQFSIYQQCSLSQIIFPPEISAQFSQTQPVLQLQNVINNQIQYLETTFDSRTLNLKQKQNTLQQQDNSNVLVIQSFNDVVGINKNLSFVFNCFQNSQFIKNVTLSATTYSNSNQTSALLQFYNYDQKNLTINISIMKIYIQNTSLFLRLPQGISYLDQTQNSILVNGFVFSQFQWQQGIISFSQANFSSTSIQISIKNVQLNVQSNGGYNISTILVKCIQNSSFVFQVDSNSKQSYQIFELPSPPTTLIKINSFNQTNANSLNILENRTSVQSQLIFSFSILQFLDTCSWLIVTIPNRFTIGFLKQSQFNLQDCVGNSYSYLQGNPISYQSVISFTDNNNCIYISCSALKLVSQSNNNNQCQNNIITIDNVKSPDLPTQTESLNLIIANSKTPAQANNFPPTFYTSSLNLSDITLPYLFFSSEQQRYQGISLQQVDLSSLSFYASSNYLGDVFNFSMTFSFPIYFSQQHKINVDLPVKLLANQTVQCFPQSKIQCSLQIGDQQIQTTIQIIFVDQVIPDIKITLQLFCAALQQSNQQNQQFFSLIRIFQQNQIINTQNKTIDVFSNFTTTQWITFSTTPLQISNSLLGIQGNNYTFLISKLFTPPNLTENYFLGLELDSSLQFNQTSLNCYLLNITLDTSLINENKIDCFFSSMNMLILPLSKILTSQSFQLRISGLRNPSGIVEQNEQNVAQTYNFQLIWSTQQGNSFKNVWLIQSVSLPITSKYTCSPNCQACASNYAACTACAPGYLKSQYNHHAVLACLPTCSPQYVAYNGTCLACQLKDPQCLSCSPSNLTQCSSCNQGYTLVPEFNGCVDSHLLQTARSRLLDYSLSTNLADNIDTTHPDDAQKSDKAQSLTRMTEESSSAKADQREGGESSSNTGSKVMGQLQDTVGALKGGGAIFIWIVLAALAVSVSQSVLRYTYNKLKGKSHSNGSSSGMRRSSSGSRSSSSGSSSAGRNASGKEHKGVREREKELRGQRIDCLMLFLLSVAEAIQMPYTLLWGFSVSGGDFESPVLQTLLGACALSTLLWIFDAYLLGSILANSENTPKTSCLLNPLPSSKREGCLSFLIVPARLAFCLIPKSVSLTLTNIFSVEGWFRYPYGEDVERATIVLTNFRKVLSSQIKSNVSGLCSLVSFLILQYPEVLSSYVQIYDLIIFDIVMTILCLTNIRNVDKLISTLNQIQESEGEL